MLVFSPGETPGERKVGVSPGETGGVRKTGVPRTTGVGRPVPQLKCSVHASTTGSNRLLK